MEGIVDRIRRTEKYPTFLATFNLASPYVGIICRRDVGKNLVRLRQNPARPVSYIRKSV
jgi:hypothetical protein